ncbi:two-component system response regulator [Gammaproteobacteria bacterium 53_120_T64]|nr:two-component system response regulator [Gammaproteobacteria bacterium 53_120_T64]
MSIKKILVCDDSKADRTKLETIVSGAGCLVISTDCGKDALQQAVSEQPDLIFLDIIMPDMDGFETCRALQNDPDTKSIPIVFVTSKGQKADRVWAQMQGGKDLVVKPYSREDIVAQINNSV